MAGYKSRPRHRNYKARRKPSRRPLRPGSDIKLKRIFKTIGIPDAKPFTPDPFQIEAIETIKKADCLVTAPTGAGKTWIAEQAIHHIFNNKGKAWYASPLKALSNSKYKEFSRIFGSDHVGILTGDRKENSNAPIIVGTTEILRNQLYDAMKNCVDLDTDFVILDEAHYLGDGDRGVVWEETMIYLPRRIPLLLLSATIGNAHQIAGWLESIRKKECIIVEEKNRPVPLYPLFLHPSGTLFPLLSGSGDAHPNNRLYKKVFKYINRKNAPRYKYSRQLPPMGDILGVLEKYNLQPVIFFLKSRADCDNALLLCENLSYRENHDRKTKRYNRINEIISLAPRIKNHKQMHYLKKLAIAAHHSGQLPIWKLLVETLMTEGLLDAVFATSTVAAGVNFPARTILFLNSDRFNGREFAPLTPTEFHQMTGRAGRRGMDNIGFATVIPGKFMDTQLTVKLFNSKPSNVYSQIKIDFSMVLNLLLSHTPDDVKALLEKSFAAFLLRNRNKKDKQQQQIHPEPQVLWQDFLRHLTFLKEKKYVTPENRLTVDGEWASQLRIDHPLMVAEGFRNNLFPKSDPVLLSAIIAAFVNERETDDNAIDPSMVPKNLYAYFKKIGNGLDAFVNQLHSNGFDFPVLFFLPALTVFLWAKGAPWEKIVSVSGMAEGDLAMLILRTADNLRHIRNIGRVFPAAAESSALAINMILRDPVVSTYPENEPVN